jgi:hypothetical protein
MAEIAGELLKLETDKIEVYHPLRNKYRVLNDEKLDKLLNRSPEVFVELGGLMCVSRCRWR